MPNLIRSFGHEEIDLEVQLNTEDEIRRAKELLAHWVIDEEKIVTISFLLKRVNLDVDRAQILMKDLAEGRPGSVNTVHMLLGRLPSEDGVARMKVVMCSQADLGKSKKAFHSVISSTIFSIQSKPIEDFQVLYNIDYCDSEGGPDYGIVLQKKTGIINRKAIKRYTGWKLTHKDKEKMQEQRSKQFVYREMMKNEPLGRKNKEEAKELRQLKKIRLSEEQTPSTTVKSSAKDANQGSERDFFTAHGSNATKDSSPPRSQSGRTALRDEQEREVGNSMDDLFCTGEDEEMEQPEGLEREAIPMNSGQTCMDQGSLFDGERKKTVTARGDQVTENEEGTMGEIDEGGYTVINTKKSRLRCTEAVDPKVLRSSNSTNFDSSAVKPNKEKRVEKGKSRSVAKGQTRISNFFSKIV